MRKATVVGWIIVIGLFRPNGIAAQTNAATSADKEVRAVEEERRQALLRNDTTTLDRLIASDFTSILNILGGRVGTKVDELGLNQTDTREVTSWTPSEVTVRIFGDVGLVTGLADVVDTLKGESRHIRFRYTNVWLKRGGRWQLVHRQATRV
jgi:ketosteroid isomerase-like protein